MNLKLYESVPYLDGGRVVSAVSEISGLDCFGLVRHALHHQFGGPLLESFNGIFRTDHCEMTEKFNSVVENDCGVGFELCAPEAGAIACCFRKTAEGDVFHHVGIFINESEVMHTCEGRGYSVVPIRAFKRLSAKVEFYKYVKGIG